MKTIYIDYVKNDDALDFIKLIIKRGNSLLNIRKRESESIKIEIDSDQKTIFSAEFNSHYNTPKNIQIIFNHLDIECFHSHIKEIVEIAYKRIPLISEEPFDSSENVFRKVCGSLELICILFKFNPPKDTLWFLSKFFFTILTSHHLVNGNKRLATMLLFDVAYASGLYFRNSKNGLYYKYEEKIGDFVIEYSNSKSDERVLNKIYEWIHENVFIALNFMDIN